MPTNGYESAFEQAKSEIIGIEEELKRLHARKDLIDKLLDCLSVLIPHSQPAPAGDLSIVEAHPHEHQGENNGYEQHQEHHQEHHEHHEHHEHEHQHQG